MSSDDFTPPRGDDAWKAEKKRVADRNEAAFARGRKERAARDAAARDRQRAADRAERDNLPKQPGPAGR